MDSRDSIPLYLSLVFGIELVLSGPLFRVSTDPESKETLIAGMGELHLQIYLERMQREYRLQVSSGEPKVNYRETTTQRAEFDYTHKKQSGGAGQYAKIQGYFEPIKHGDDVDANSPNVFINELVSCTPLVLFCIPVIAQSVV